MARPHQPVLTADIIADAAIALIDSGQPFGVNALARALGVKPPSLYNHVQGLEAIIELVRGRLSSRYMAELPIDAPWDQVIELIIRAERLMYTSHPRIIPLIATSTVTEPRVILAYDTIASAMVDAGFPDNEVLVLIQLMDAFTLGSGLDYAASDVVWQPEGETRNLGRLLRLEPKGTVRNNQAFEIGLEMLLTTLRARLQEYQKA
ncbi:TetR/AcrR family transcriptional regulator [Glutamicibacter halophytocola]|uniref:TetR/AcrR family transcriptional regulator C-terminal domain-containing protein n=1 Tax=Glutamicibacter halophytocola TaxID=1933880 RepID=A0AA94XXB3_9MICC|nr:TetR/AcrR family transcriptional regulator C-terminal domain-containing protein [Glutamicibacter halophytocola]UUX58717.1 TetR/AcrR family transcriptional regulator C-terminal domain-containing protein [Glutamicibacter halophytocola]